MRDIIRIHERDNVAVALRDIHAGETVELAGSGSLAPQGAVEGCGATEGDGAMDRDAAGMQGCALVAKDVVAMSGQASADGTYSTKIKALEEIPAGHKMALQDIPEGAQVIKYGYPIGSMMESVKTGAWIHTHNIKTGLGDLLEYNYNPVFAKGEACGNDRIGTCSGKPWDRQKFCGMEGGRIETADKNATFLGFRRPDGRVGVRNEIWIIPTVGCVNNVATEIARRANGWLASWNEIGREGMGGAGQIDVGEVIAFPHPYGCSQMGDDQEYTRKILADLIGHPNAGGVLVLGLGCENSNIDVLKPYIMEAGHSGKYDEDRVKFLVSQECEDEVEEGLEMVKGLIRYASSFRREPVDVSELIIGMKCGGSDGLSGITANPLVGRFSDELIARGGTTILTEVPEMFGAETILMNRCANEELFSQTVDLINDFKTYFKRHGQTIYENPSPGNKKGGISTLEDKSLGCTQKSGSAPVKGVLQYGERVCTPGLNLLGAPGNDLVAATALAAAGAQIVLFTTGRGTPFASPVPTVKISTNSVLAQKKSNWIDFNAGVLAEDGQMEVETQKLFDYVIEVASGRKVCSEEAGYHDMAIFKQGVTL